MKTKEKENPNHHMGKKTGYELIDGVYQIAPLYQEQFEKLLNRKMGLNGMLNMVSSHVATDLEVISKQSDSIWKELKEDIGLDDSKNWAYRNGEVREQTSK